MISLEQRIEQKISAAYDAHQAGRLDVAEAQYRSLLSEHPALTDVLYLLSALLSETRQDEALKLAERALTASAGRGGMGVTEAMLLDHYAACLGRQGADPALEADVLAKAQSVDPDGVERLFRLAEAQRRAGRWADTMASLQRYLANRPNDVNARSNLGTLQMKLGNLADSIVTLEQTIAIEPRHVHALNNLGVALQMLGRLEEAEASCRRALQIKPEYAEALSNLGSILGEMGRLKEAEASYRRALEIKPESAEARSNLLFTLSCLGCTSSEDYIAEARKWDRCVLPNATRVQAQSRTFSLPWRIDRRLRVGYVSGDFRDHAMSNFIEPLLRSHDRSRIELFAFSASPVRDGMSERLEGLVDQWQSIAWMSDENARQHIEAQGIDVLVDLSGHTRQNRLGVFARRAAPVQAHYLGYFASTGLCEMDYWIGDPIVLPDSEDLYYSEKIWRLPRVWLAYSKQVDTPAAQWQPAADGSVRIGSFNHLRKLTQATLKLWSEILHALPEAKLMLKTKELDLTVNRQRVEREMLDYGIGPERLELVGATPDWHSHMALYHKLDIALDPVGGLGGGTTTCEALWMGVPVVTLLGHQMGQRMTTSMLNAIGRLEWKAETESEYRDKVVALARDVDQRRSMRLGQRERMRSSALCDVAGLAAALEDAYEQMFDRWREAGNVASGPVCETPVAKRP